MFFIKNKGRNFPCKSVYGFQNTRLVLQVDLSRRQPSASTLNSKTPQLNLIPLKTRFVNLFVSRVQVFSTCMQKLNSPSLETFQLIIWRVYVLRTFSYSDQESQYQDEIPTFSGVQRSNKLHWNRKTAVFSQTELVRLEASLTIGLQCSEYFGNTLFQAHFINT